MVVRPFQFSTVLTVEKGSLFVSFHFPEYIHYIRKAYSVTLLTLLFLLANGVRLLWFLVADAASL